MENEDPVFDLVRAQLLALDIAGTGQDAIGSDTLLVEDVGIDSLRFVDLTVGLEDALGIAEFPMQDWVDGRLENGEPLTVGALVRACREILEQKGESR